MFTRKNKTLLILFLCIFLVIFWRVNYGVEKDDNFFSLNQFLFFDAAPHCVNIPLFLTSYLGNKLIQVSIALGIPPVLFIRIFTATFRALAAIVIFRTLAPDLGKYTVIFGLLLGALFEKAACLNFFYSFVSLYGFALMLCALLTALKHNSKKHYFLCGLIYAFCIFCRCSNILYGAAFMLLFLFRPFSRERLSEQRAPILSIGSGIFVGVIISAGLIHTSLGFTEYSQILENVKASSVDGHGVGHLLISLGYRLSIGMVLTLALGCIAATYSRVLKRVGTGFKPYSLFIGIGIAFFLYLWADPFLINVFSFARLASFNTAFISVAAAFLTLYSVCILLNKTECTLFQKRIITATAIFALVGHFGSLVSLGLCIYCMSFIMPVCLFCCKEIGLLTFLSQKHLFCTAWRHTCFSLASCQAAVLLFFAFTFTFNVLNRPTPEKARNEYLEAHHIPLFRGIKLTAEEKSYYESLATELSAYANPQRQLLSMSFPADNAILGMAPFLQWQGGWTSLTYPKDMQRQLENAPSAPYILMPAHTYRQTDQWQQQQKIIFDYIATNRYSKIETPNFLFFIPTQQEKQER